MTRRRLDEKLMTKLMRKLGKTRLSDVNKLVSARARTNRISSEAALCLLASGNGIGSARYLRTLDPAKQAEVRYQVPLSNATVARTLKRLPNGRSRGEYSSDRRAAAKAAVQYLIQDAELLERCADLLLARRNFDRAINQATLILEDRIRQKAQPPTTMSGSDLIGFSFNEELARTRLQVASGDGGDQRGFTQILKGIVPTFRNPTHHHVINSFSQEDAMRVCGFIDVLLRVVDSSTKVR